MFLFFDLDDTLYDQYLPFEAAYLEIFGDTPREKMNDIFVKSRRLAGQAYAMVDRGELAPGEVYCYRLIRAFETYGVKLPHAIAHTFRDAYDKTQSHIALSLRCGGALRLHVQRAGAASAAQGGSLGAFGLF